jgi:hypothetical protein
VRIVLARVPSATSTLNAPGTAAPSGRTPRQSADSSTGGPCGRCGRAAGGREGVTPAIAEANPATAFHPAVVGPTRGRHPARTPPFGREAVPRPGGHFLPLSLRSRGTLGPKENACLRHRLTTRDLGPPRWIPRVAPLAVQLKCPPVHWPAAFSRQTKLRTHFSAYLGTCPSRLRLVATAGASAFRLTPSAFEKPLRNREYQRGKSAGERTAACIADQRPGRAARPVRPADGKGVTPASRRRSQCKPSVPPARRPPAPRQTPRPRPRPGALPPGPPPRNPHAVGGGVQFT